MTRQIIATKNEPEWTRFFLGFTVTLAIYVDLYLFHCNTPKMSFNNFFHHPRNFHLNTTKKHTPLTELKLSFSRLRELRRGVLLTRHRGSPWNHPVEQNPSFAMGFQTPTSPTSPGCSPRRGCFKQGTSWKPLFSRKWSPLKGSCQDDFPFCGKVGYIIKTQEFFLGSWFFFWVHVEVQKHVHCSPATRSHLGNV